jgi:hypothetical protein
MNIRTAMAKAAFNEKNYIFISKLELRGKNSKLLHLVLKRGNFEKYFRNTWKCCAEKGWRSSIGPIV